MSIELNNVSYSYNNSGQTVIQDVSFFMQNEIVAILAPTGAGKTTLLNIISGFLTPLKGQVLIDGLFPEKARKEKRIGFSFQNSTLIEWKNVIENISLPLTIGIKEPINEDQHSYIEELIVLIGLKGFEQYKCSELSGGMKQRVGLARALVTNPSLILFDEPFNKLDFVTKSNLITEHRRILKQRDLNCILVTHNIEDALFLADRILICSDVPLKIMHDIFVDFGINRDESLYYEESFLKKVAEIKKLILR